MFAGRNILPLFLLRMIGAVNFCHVFGFGMHGHLWLEPVRKVFGCTRASKSRGRLPCFIVEIFRCNWAQRPVKAEWFGGFRWLAGFLARKCQHAVTSNANAIECQELRFRICWYGWKQTPPGSSRMEPLNGHQVCFLLGSGQEHMYHMLVFFRWVLLQSCSTIQSFEQKWWLTNAESLRLLFALVQR